MNNYTDFIKECGILVKNIGYLNGKFIITSEDGKKYLLLSKNKDIFSYLKNIDYSFYIEPFKSNDYFDLFEYNDDIVDDDYKKGKEIIYALSILHCKTYSFSDNNDLNNILEKYKYEIEESLKYYLDLQDYIDELDFLSPQYYLLILNISNIYKILQYGKKIIDELLTKDSLSIRKSICVGNCSCDNFVSEKNKYFIDWTNASNNYIIYDFVSFYKSNFSRIDMNSLFDIYNDKILLSNDEFNLLVGIICIPKIIHFTKNNYKNTLMVRELVDYVSKTYEFVLEKNEKYEKTNKNEFS